MRAPTDTASDAIAGRLTVAISACISTAARTAGTARPAAAVAARRPPTSLPGTAERAIRAYRSRASGLPRTADAIARKGPGLPVIPLDGARPASLGALQPGDLVFFELDTRTGAALDHSGIYLGLDTEGHPRFLSSREEANGPTFGDLGGSSPLDGDGYYAKALRGAKRL